MEYKDLWDYALHNDFNQKLLWQDDEIFDIEYPLILERVNANGSIGFVLHDKRTTNSRFILSYCNPEIKDLEVDIDISLPLIDQISLLNTFVIVYSQRKILS